MTSHVCSFPQIKILKAEKGEELLESDQVLAPCRECGETPFDHFEFMENRQKELQDALLAVQPYRPLYHWAPTSRRKQIIRYGLRPYMRPTTSDGNDRKIPYICFADSPSWAWALSGGQRRFPKGDKWDLWMAWLNDITDPVVHSTSDRPSGLYEVRTEHRLYKRNLWYVGSRTK